MRFFFLHFSMLERTEIFDTKILKIMHDTKKNDAPPTW